MNDVTDSRGRQNTNPRGIGFWALVAEDYATHSSDFFAQGFWALFWHRFGNWRMSVQPFVLRAPLSVVYRTMSKCVQWFGGIYLPYTVIVGRRLKIEHFGGMILVAKRIGDDVIIRQNTTLGIASLEDLQARPVIGDRVELGAGVVVIGAITIGPDTKVGANAVATTDLPGGVVAVGVPARVLRPRNASLEDG